MDILKQILDLFLPSLGDSKYTKMVHKYGADFPVTPKNDKVRVLWKQWSQKIHYTSDQYWRRKRALEQTIPLCIDLENLTGKFLGSEGELYDVTLNSCDCIDFSVNHLPCKHIYRLFSDIESNKPLSLDLGVANAFLIKQDENNKQLTKNNYNGIPVSAIQFLASVSKELVTKQYIKISKVTPDINILIEYGVLSTSIDRDYAALLNQMTKDEIILALAKKNVNGYKSYWTKANLINWIIENQNSFLEKHFRKSMRLIIQDDKKDYIQKLYENKSSYDKFPSYF